MSTNVSTDDAREALRREHGVRLVSAAEEGDSATALPAGVYGFTSSPALASPLFATRRYRNFEVHRLPDGPAVIGFVTTPDAARLMSDDNAPVAITLHPDADDDASTIVAVSYDRIMQHRQYSVRNTAAIVLHVLPGRAELTHA